MPTQAHVNNLYINKLTTAQFNTAVQGGVISDSDISILSDGGYIQYSVMPTPSEENMGQIVQYVGETNDNYVNGYWYKCVFVRGPIEEITVTPNDVITLNAENYRHLIMDIVSPSVAPNTNPEDFFQAIVDNQYSPISPTYAPSLRYLTSGNSWQIYYDARPYDYGSFPTSTANLESCGINWVTSAPSSDTTINLSNLVYDLNSLYAWEIIDVQPTIQTSIMPEPSQAMANKIVQYIGETGQYENSQFYKCELSGETDVASGIMTPDAFYETNAVFEFNKDVFNNYVTNIRHMPKMGYTSEPIDYEIYINTVYNDPYYCLEITYWLDDDSNMQTTIAVIISETTPTADDVKAALALIGITPISNYGDLTQIGGTIYPPSGPGYVWNKAFVDGIGQYKTMPEAEVCYNNSTIQYIGSTVSSYYSNYFYKCIQSENKSVKSGEAWTDGFYTDDTFYRITPPVITFNVNTFNTYAQANGLPVITDRYIEIVDNTTEIEIYYNESNETMVIPITTTQTDALALAGITITWDTTIGESPISSAGMYLPSDYTYSWERTDVQPNIQREVLDNTSNYNGEIVQYIGNTADNYTQGYFYKSVEGYEYAGETDRTYSGTNYMYLSVDNLKLTSFLNLYGYTYTDTNIILLSITSDPTNPYTVSSLNGDIDTSFSSVEELRAWTGINWGGTNYVTSTDPNAIRSTSNTSTEFKVIPGYLWEHIAVAGPDIVRDYTSTDIRIILGNVNNNKIFDLGEPATITVEGDLGTSEDFCCQINFGSTDPVPTDFITAGGVGIEMTGDDIDFTTHEFVPVTGRAYTIFFYYARNTFRGIVQGV